MLTHKTFFSLENDKRMKRTLAHQKKNNFKKMSDERKIDKIENCVCVFLNAELANEIDKKSTHWGSIEAIK